MKTNKKYCSSARGITLIALVITIIVLLILAGISISMLSGEDSILQRVTDAKIETEKGQEKEVIALAYNSALAKKAGNSNSSAVTDSELNDELDNSEATAAGNPIIVTFIKSGNAYQIDSNGIIKESTLKDPNVTPKVSENKEKIFDTNKDLLDDYGNKITVPAGFKITSDSPSVVTDGIIIEDVTYTNTIGSQFVWIPIGNIYTNESKTQSKTIELSRYEFDRDDGGTPHKYGVLSVSEVRRILDDLPIEAKTEVDQMLGNGAYEELIGLKEKTDNEIQAWINAGGEIERKLENLFFEVKEETESREGSSTQNATAKNLNDFLLKATKGYYIGRYEARVENGTLDLTNYNNINGTAPNIDWTGYIGGKLVEKGDNQVFNYITQKKAAELSRKMYYNDNFTSDLMNSYAWDTATLFLQEFGEENYSIKSTVNDSLASKGTNDSNYNGTRDIVCNIYDMASNCTEWTTETSNDSEYPCSTRGGYYNDGYSFTSWGRRWGYVNCCL